MKALILCAGLGTRLKPLSEQLPKALFPILGKPLLAFIISHLQDTGVEKIAINTHHLPQMIETFFEHQSCLKSKIHISYESEILGTGGAISQLKDFFHEEEYFILYNGDIFTNIELKPVIRKHATERALITMILHNRSPQNNVVINKQGEIIDLRGMLGVSPSPPNSSLAYTGISILGREFLNYCPEKNFCDLIEILVNIIRDKRGKVIGYIAKNSYWQDIGTIEGYFSVHKDILLKKRRVSKELPDFSDNIFKGEGTFIEGGVSLKGFCSIGNNCLVKKGAQLENCILWDFTVVEENEKLKNCIKSGEIICYVSV